MRIAIFHNQPGGGARRALHGFARELRQRHSIDVYTLTTADDVFLDDYEIADTVVRMPYAARKPIRFGLYANDVRRRRDFHDLVAVNVEAARRIDVGGYDVVLVDVCRYTLIPPILTQLRTPSVYYAHDPPARSASEDWTPAQSGWGRARDLWHKPFLDRQAKLLTEQQASAVRAATRVSTNSHYTAGRYRTAFGVEATVCPPGVDAASEMKRARNRKEVLAVGELEPHKGYPFLVDALACMEAGDRPTLRIVANRANPVERARLESRAREQRVRCVIELGLSHGALDDAYHRAGAFVFSAHSEPLGLAPLEAMAHGVPVVAVGEGGVSETVIDEVTGFLVPRDARQFASRLQELLGDELLARRFGSNGRAAIADRWNWTDRAAALDAVLEAAARREEVSAS